jgi:hypothetical protein
MKDYVAKDWLPVLGANGLDGFDAIWALDIGWFEAPNERRGGWSGVSRCELQLPGDGSAGVFVKRQQDHVYRSLRHPLRGMLTFAREFANLLRYRSHGIPTLEPLYFAIRNQDGHHRAILVTRELSGYDSLDRCVERWQAQGAFPRSQRQALITEVAAAAAQLHRHHLQHNCFYPKHIFIGQLDGAVDVRIIDLEKTKWRLSRTRASLRDLDTLNRHAAGWSRTDRLRFLLAYYQVDRVDARVRKTWQRLAARLRSKQRRRN